MAMEDYVEKMKEGRRKREGDGFKQVYTPNKKKEDKVMACSSGDWEQTVRLKHGDFPELKEHKIGEHLTVTLKGPLVSMDKESVCVGVHKVKVGE